MIRIKPCEVRSGMKVQVVGYEETGEILGVKGMKWRFVEVRLQSGKLVLCTADEITPIDQKEVK